MTYKEAVENLKYLISGECTGNQMDFIEEIEMTINALEKQIPKKPKKDKEYPLGRVCPKCGAYLGNVQFMASNYDYCRWCGQAIDWSKK